MKKNVASQVIGAQMVSATDGSAFTGTVSCSVCGDGGTQAAGGGVVTHEGNGFHSYTPTQAETNYNHVAFTFTGTGAVPVTIQVYPSFPQTGDSYATVNTNLDAAVSSRSSHAAADVWSVATRALTDKAGFGLAAGAITSTVVADGALTAAKFAAGAFDAVWTVASRTLTGFGTLVADIWGYATRVLTGGDNIVLAKGTGVTGFNDLDAAGVRTAVGLAAANLDTQLDAVPTATENADALLNRNMASVGDTNARTPLNALRKLINKWSITGTTLTVTKEDDATQAYTQTLTSSASAEAITGLDTN